VEPYSANTDNELHDWLLWADEHGTILGADIPHYLLLRPVLLKLKEMYPRTRGSCR
jgi:hypothetical protein